MKNIRQNLIDQLTNNEGEVFELIKEMVELSHKSTNCNRLYVHTNGNVWIGTEASDNSWAVIPGTNKLVENIGKCYNSCGCNCDWCADKEYEFDITDFGDDVEDWRNDAIEKLEQIEDGYFDDETNI